MYRIRNQGMGLVELVFVLALGGLCIAIGGAAIRWLSTDFQQVVMVQTSDRLFQMIEGKVRKDLSTSNGTTFFDGIEIHSVSDGNTVESSYRIVCQHREGWVWEIGASAEGCENPCSDDQIARVAISRCKAGTCATHSVPAYRDDGEFAMLACFSQHGSAIVMNLHSIRRSASGDQVVRTHRAVLNEAAAFSDRVDLLE